MKAKLIIITVLALCSFTASAQEFIAPYNMMRSTQSNVDVIDTVPANEVWKVESFGFNDDYLESNNCYPKYYLNDHLIDIGQNSKLPFWLDSGDILLLPYRIYKQPTSINTQNDLEFISILRFKKPD